MEKLVYILRREDDFQAGLALRESLLSDVVPALREAGAERISVNVRDPHVAAGETNTMRFSDPPVCGAVTFWLDCADDRRPCETALAKTDCVIDGYLVAEARPLRHDPPVGERTPGANLVTCIVRKAGLDDDTFNDLWTIEHRAVALETQSTFSYVRNAVVRKLTPGARDLDGIVEEGFPIGALSDPQIWYDCPGDAEELTRRIQRMVASVTAFLDLSKLDTTPMSEYYLG